MPKGPRATLRRDEPFSGILTEEERMAIFRYFETL